eukprot:scaffold9085_cov215-Amphora_coffeaeformis.AAC.22
MKYTLLFFCIALCVPQSYRGPSLVSGLDHLEDEVGFLRRSSALVNRTNNHHVVARKVDSIPPGFGEVLGQAIAELGAIQESTSALAWQRQLRSKKTEKEGPASEPKRGDARRKSKKRSGLSSLCKTTSPKLRSFLSLHDSILHGRNPFQRRSKLFRTTTSHRRKRRRRRLVQEKCSLGDPGNQKKCERCHDLVKCVKDMTTYDLFVFFYGDDIDFDKGEMDDEITNFDADDITQKRSQIRQKLAAAKTFLNESITPAFDEGDPCDKLLREFQ